MREGYYEGYHHSIKCSVNGCGKIAVGMAEDGNYYCEEHMCELFGYVPTVLF